MQLQQYAAVRNAPTSYHKDSTCSISASSQCNIMNLYTHLSTADIKKSLMQQLSTQQLSSHDFLIFDAYKNAHNIIHITKYTTHPV